MFCRFVGTGDLAEKELKDKCVYWLDFSNIGLTGALGVRISDSRRTEFPVWKGIYAGGYDEFLKAWEIV